MNAPAQEPGKKGKPLSPEQEASLIEIDLIIRTARRDEECASLEKAKAFARAKTGRLYLKDFKTMKEFGLSYEIEPWNTSRLSKAGTVFYNLQSLWDEEDVVGPTSAWQLLPLARLKTVEDQRAGWLAAVMSSDNTVPSEAKVEAAVAALRPPKAEDATAQVDDSGNNPAAKLSLAIEDVTKAIKELCLKIEATEQPALIKKLGALQQLCGEQASKMEGSKPPVPPLRFPKRRAMVRTFIDPELRMAWNYLTMAGFFRS